MFKKSNLVHCTCNSQTVSFEQTNYNGSCTHCCVLIMNLKLGNCEDQCQFLSIGRWLTERLRLVTVPYS